MDSKGKLILKNSTMLSIRMAITMLVGLYTSRVILDALGVQDYGIYNVVGSLTTMFMFLNSSMAISTSRFLTFGLGKNDDDNISKVYQQSVIIHIAIAIGIFLLIETVGRWFLYNQLIIPSERLLAAEWVLHTVAVVAVLNVLSTPDMSLIIAYEKMASFAYISLFEVIIKLLIAYLLTLFGGDRLILYAILLMVAQLIIRMSYYIYSKRTFAVARGKLVYSKQNFKEMVAFASWNLLGNVALMAIDQGVNILLNIFCGPVVNAARGISNQVSNYANTFVMNIRMAINPQITKSYSSRDISYMHTLIKYSSLSCYYLLLVISATLFWLVDDILDIWLVEVPTYTGTFFRLSLIYLMANSFANPVIIGVHSTGNIVRFQIVEGVLMLLTLPLAWLFLNQGLPPYWVYTAQISVAIVSQTGRLYVALPAIKMSIGYYTKQILSPCAIVTFISLIILIGLYSIGYSYHYGITHSMIMAILSFCGTIFTIYTLGINAMERKYVNNVVCKFLKR